MRSTRDDDNKLDAPEPAPAPAPHAGPAPSKPGLSLEERVERLEKRLVPIIGEL